MPGRDYDSWEGRRGVRQHKREQPTKMRPLMREVSVESLQLDVTMLKITSAGLRMQLHWQHACLALLRPGV